MTLPRNKLKKRIAPGLWEDAAGDLHISVPELLALVNLEDTPDNRALAAEMARSVIREKLPKNMIVTREKPD